MTEPYRGSCLCGAVRYIVRGELRHVVGCHCGQCRKTSGHYVAATSYQHVSTPYSTHGVSQIHKRSADAEPAYYGRYSAYPRSYGYNYGYRSYGYPYGFRSYGRYAYGY